MDSYPGSSNSGTNGDSLLDSQYEELMTFMYDNKDQMRKAAKSAVKQGLMAGGGAVIGGILLGPVGGLIGGVAGSVAGYKQADDYEGVLQRIQLLEGTKRRKLVRDVQQVLTSVAGSARGAEMLESADSFREGLLEFATRPGVRENIFRACMQSLD